MQPDMQHILNGANQAGHRSPSDSGPWTHHWEDENGKKWSAQYWLPGQHTPTGEIPRNPIPEYREARTRGRQSGHGARGLREGYGMGFPEGYEDGFDKVESGGRAWQTGFGRGMFFGGMAGYYDGYDDYFDDWDQYGRYGAGFDGGPGAFDGYEGYGGGYDREYDEGFGGYGGGYYGWAYGDRCDGGYGGDYGYY